ncbi:MAG TPA: 3-oxoacyl-ACP synthase, partial [Woeseiaceae bacterium]|nr:3-oxoacyl-ACP synthase [Woeseiaceae bacterium]
MNYSSIAGTGAYLPERVMANKDFEAMVDTSDEWIRERTGIKRRHIAAEDQTTSDMALEAALQALQMAGASKEDIDLIIVATTTPDKVFPSTACLVQRRLGVSGFAAFDVHAACAGFIYALDVANRFIKTGGASCVLVIGAETYSRIINWKDRGTCVL